MNVVVVGAGYVGLANALMISRNFKTKLFDIDSSKIDKLKNNESPIHEKEIDEFLHRSRNLNISYTDSDIKLYVSSSFVIIATPTDYSENNKSFDTTSVRETIKKVWSQNKNAFIIVKSTVPVGFTESIKSEFSNNRICFSPEFLREGRSIYDTLHPSRIIIGDNTPISEEIASLFLLGVEEKDVEVLFMSSTEAESVKLFSNTFLAMRVAFFNELDTFAINHNINPLNIISGVCSDKRIGKHYRNPSFGYGGYCLPKDTKQLKSDFKNIPNNLIGAIVDSNETRKNYIVELVKKKKPGIIGIYRLIMKTGSDNYRESSIISVMEKLSNQGLKLMIYEPLIKEEEFNGIEVQKNLEFFLTSSDLILANRLDSIIIDFKEKVLSRDIYGDD